MAGDIAIIPTAQGWARDDKLMPPAYADRLAEHFENAQLVRVDDSRPLISIDQPKILRDHLRYS